MLKINKRLTKKPHVDFGVTRKSNLLRHIYIFEQTNDMMELAEVFVDIVKIFKAEDFPIDDYIKSISRQKRKKIIKFRKYKPKII